MGSVSSQENEAVGETRILLADIETSFIQIKDLVIKSQSQDVYLLVERQFRLLKAHLLKLEIMVPQLDLVTHFTLTEVAKEIIVLVRGYLQDDVKFTDTLTRLTQQMTRLKNDAKR